MERLNGEAPASCSLAAGGDGAVRSGLFACVVVLCVAGAAWGDSFAERRDENWHQWRGPEGNGFAPRGDPPVRWDEGTNVRWKVAVPGRGTSTPVVWEDRIFILTAIRSEPQGEKRLREGDSPHFADAASELIPPTGKMGTVPDVARGGGRADGRGRPTHYHQFMVLCLDRGTGRTLWERVACEVVPHEGHHSTFNSFASASPVTDGRHVYCSFGSRGVYCYDMDGKEQWKADLGQFEIKYEFGEGSSPALFEDTLIVNCDHEGQSFITALEAATGERRWTVPRDENSTWNTPLAAEHDGRAQVIVNGARRARSYDLATGELVWEYGERPGVDAIPSPMRLGDLAIFVSGLRGDPAYAVPLNSVGDLTGTDELVWKHTRGTPQVASAVLVGERLYFTQGRQGILTCLGARTGEVMIDRRRLRGLEDIYASPVAAAGRAYFTCRSGVTVVIDATVDEVRVLAENRLEEALVGSPAIVGREMFLRGEGHLYCIAEE